MRELLMPLKVRKFFVLSADYIGSGKVEIVLPGGENFCSSIPDWEKINRLPKNMPIIQKIAAAFGFADKKFTNASVLSYDFETLTPGISPNPTQDTLLSAAFWGDNYASVLKGKPDEVLQFFIDTVKTRNPDILAGYFANRYDMLVAINASERYNIPLKIGRDNSEPEVIYRNFDRSATAGDRFKVKMILINGRLHFDVFDEVIYDQSLIGIKGIGLKTVAKFLKIPNIVEVNRRAVAMLKPETLLNYNLSDARLTYILTKVYLSRLTQLSENMELPLNLVMSRTPSHVPNYIYARDFLTRNIPYSGDNQTRFPVIFSKKKCYQGGYVNIFNKGIFKPVDKIDFVNLYPALMVMGNFDPYTVKLVKIDPYTSSDPIFNGNRITVSDKIVGDVTCEIDLSKDSATRTSFLKFIKTKRDLKPLSKIDPLAKSQYWVVKLIMNASYGYHGNRYARWGCVLISILTTALGRWFLETICKIEPAKIEADTDGLYIKSKLSNKDLLSYQKIVRNLVPDIYMKEVIELDLDHYKAGLFTDEKNYILQNMNDTLLFHGAGLKGMHLPIVCDKVLENVIKSLLSDGDWRKVIHEAQTLPENFDDFIMKARFNKTGYTGNSLYAQLEKQLKKHHIPVNAGDTVRYVKTIGGYNVVGLAGREDIDEEYYLNRIAAIVARALKPVEGLKPKEIRKIMKHKGLI